MSMAGLRLDTSWGPCTPPCEVTHWLQQAGMCRWVLLAIPARLSVCTVYDNFSLYSSTFSWFWKDLLTTWRSIYSILKVIKLLKAMGKMFLASLLEGGPWKGRRILVSPSALSSLFSPADRLSWGAGMPELVIVGRSAEKRVSIISTAYHPPWDRRCFERIPDPWRCLTCLKAAEKERQK